jgi:CHAD domain-containing protein
MAYRLKLEEPIAEGVRRVGLEQIEMATSKLAGNGDMAAAIHDARRCLKRLRALLRLIRPALPETAYERETERLAGIGRLLAGARDRHVMQHTIAKLEARFGPLPQEAALRLRKRLGQDGVRGRRGRGDGRQQALRRLEQSQRLFTGRAMNGVDLDHLLEGLEASYRKARKAFRRAYREGSNEAFHAWRKRVQAHWRHMGLLSRSWPEAMSARAGEAKELSRLLGEDHDLAVLLAFARADGSPALGDAHLEELAQRCVACQGELRAAARPRGERLFAEPASDLKERVGLYWGSARALADLAPAEGKDGAGAPRADKAKTAKGAAKRLTGARYRRR